MKKINNKAFTLIELLVVISILGVLASIIFVSMSSVRGKSRDARRALELSQITKALEYYYTENDFYPDCADKSDLVANWSCMLTELKDAGIIGKTSSYLAIMAPPPDLDTSIQDPLYPSKTYSYMVSENGMGYRIRAHLEDLSNPLLDQGITGPFLYSDIETGDEACDNNLGYYCIGIEPFDPGL